MRLARHCRPRTALGTHEGVAGRASGGVLLPLRSHPDAHGSQHGLFLEKVSAKDAEGYASDDRGRGLEPPRTLIWIAADRAAQLTDLPARRPPTSTCSPTRRRNSRHSPRRRCRRSDRGSSVRRTGSSPRCRPPPSCAVPQRRPHEDHDEVTTELRTIRRSAYCRYAHALTLDSLCGLPVRLSVESRQRAAAAPRPRDLRNDALRVRRPRMTTAA
jgi:hypothetical protein